MNALYPRPWVPVDCETHILALAQQSTKPSRDISARLDDLVEENRRIHEERCFNLNPASNVMNPKAEAAQAKGLGSRASLGYPGDKYEMGLEAIEEIEVLAAELSAEIFRARFAEVRVPSGAIANLFAFMAICKPGDTIIAPPASIGGHVTHHDAGCAGLYGLNIKHAPVSADGYTVDLDGLRALAKQENPKLITIGGSLNLFEHPVKEIRAIADEVGARVLFDAAHQCGMIAGSLWSNPLENGADIMTMSTYKSLGGPAGGLIVTNDADLAEKIDRIAFPGMTANFDPGKTAALAYTMLDWREFGHAYAKAMQATSQAFAGQLDRAGIPIFAKARGYTLSHQFAIEAASFGGGQTAAKKIAKAGFLACGIGLPIAPVNGDLNGLRIGTPEMVRWGVSVEDIPQIADILARALTGDTPENLTEETATLRKRFNKVHYVLD
ncbi:serine hydroxymethyltransferase [Roseibium sediminis]|uniref:serine hydroxymethyltransferase n=1 Tax=Roseibium sediminis TaxID=1775174 RepID=UPI00123D3AED|nr:aminotransferase class I/II-fold pyridoxal phosphate-dependent enzyme [Roseibium sediminis]